MSNNKNVKKVNLKKIKKKNMNQLELTWLTHYMRYKIGITKKKKSGTNNEAQDLITISQMMNLKGKKKG
jgi:hypothetical protein